MTPIRRWIKKALARALPAEQFLLQGADHGGVVTSAGECEVVSISLTFDDGPDPLWTPPVLDALDAAGWTGTFFLIGRKAEAHPDLVHEILERGHEIGNHSYAHCEPDDIGVQQFSAGVIHTQRLLTSMAGRNVSLMRPPKGRLDVQKTRALWQCGQSVVLWNIDPCDYRMTCSDHASAWALSYQPSAGDIVLLHDRLPYAGEIVRTLAEVHGQALRSVAVSNWLRGSASGGENAAKQFLGNLVTS